MRAASYLAIAIVLIAFGYLALFSIGTPFLLTGVLMLVLWRYRSRSDVMAPALLWPWIFTGAYVLLGPLGCTSTPVEAPGEAVVGTFTTCTNLLGIDYSGSGSYSPSLWPASLAAAALATTVAIIVRVLLRRPGCAAP